MLDCYDFYLWSVGELLVSKKRLAKNYFEKEEPEYEY